MKSFFSKKVIIILIIMMITATAIVGSQSQSTAVLETCIGEIQGICKVTPLTDLISKVNKSHKWTDTTGLIKEPLLAELEKVTSSGKVLVYGIFVLNEDFNTIETSILLGEKYGLVYPSDTPAVTIVVLVDSNGEIVSYHCYNIWSNDYDLNWSEALYSEYSIIDDKTFGLISWVNGLAQGQDRILIQIPPDVPYFPDSGIKTFLFDFQIIPPITVNLFEIADVKFDKYAVKTTFEHNGSIFWYTIKWFENNKLIHKEVIFPNMTYIDNIGNFIKLNGSLETGKFSFSFPVK